MLILHIQALFRIPLFIQHDLPPVSHTLPAPLLILNPLTWPDHAPRHGWDVLLLKTKTASGGGGRTTLRKRKLGGPPTMHTAHFCFFSEKEGETGGSKQASCMEQSHISITGRHGPGIN